MPQIFQVLRCYKCLVFQVHQTKKSNKWDCKLCGEKQSIKRHYGLGTGKDCRLHVHRLNGLRAEIDELKDNQNSGNSDSDDHVPPTKKTTYQPLQDSKWSNYMDETQSVEDNSNENMSLEGAEVVLEIPKKRRFLLNNSLKKQTKVQENLNYEIIPDDNEDNIRAQSVLSKPDVQCVDLILQKENFNTIKSNMKNKFIPLVLNKNSKWVQFTEDAEQSEPDKEITQSVTALQTDMKNNMKNKFILPVLNKNSKWAQFTEDAEQSEPDKETTQSITASQTDLLFSLCDDNDLDNILDI